MKNLTTKIVTSVLALVLTVAALGTGVFAWFTINNQAKATGFEGQVQAAQGGFLLSSDGTNYTTSLDLNEILKDKLSKLKFKDLTTKDGISFVDSNNKEALETSYITFDLNFIAINFTEVFVTTDITGDTTSWKSEYAVDGVNVGDTLVSSAANALRVAYVTEDKTVKYVEASQDYNGTGSIAGTAKKNTQGILTKETNFAYQYLVKSGSTKAFDATKETVLVADEAKRLGNTDAKVLTLTKTEAPADYAEYTNAGKLTVNIWIEGWDAEAFNAILNGKVKVDFNFQAK
ncbi:conserved hypothetical protein [Alteracholeplasma palmae J233]|uniref:Uncharacterized protein n=1 Tax=Alteracholeplasma palmae (strain ATCC 49389 / J233) TaxID=1318466 RepID=U4KRF4_ALTPJ|nr:hypothetical protein [Alteracholeplasma palmae]CCV64116.1 conserved hypothetical protein [Alteracholeplasma palmae J233]